MKRNLLLIALFAIFAMGANAQILSQETFDSGIPAGWQTVTPSYSTNGDYHTKWHAADHTGSFYIRASSYDAGNHATEQWIMTPAFSTSGYSSVTLTFDNDQADYPGNALQAYYSTNYSGDSASHASATWVEITGLTLSSGGYTVVTNTSDISAAAGNANVYIGFKYSSTASEGAVWDVDNVAVSGVASVDGVATTTKIFPNPVSAVLNISSENQISSVELLNVIGQRISTQEVNSQSTTINTANLVKGVYFAKVNNANGTSTITKIVKR